MRVRQIIATKKTQSADTLWRTTDLPVKYAPVYKKPRPMKAGWTWRSIELDAEGQAWVLTVQCHVTKDNWQAWLMKKFPDGTGSIVARFEYHGSHAGVHIHSSCDRSGLEPGGTSIDNLNRFPNSSSSHRRIVNFTKETFWERSLKFFHVDEIKGTLI